MNHWLDYVIFVVFLCTSIAIGLYFSLTGGRQKTTEEFLMADRSLKVLPTTISLLVSFQSAIMIIGHTAEIYTGGTSAWVNAMISFCISLTIVTWIFVPWLFRMRITSINKILELRFGRKLVRVWGSVLNIIAQVSYMGTSMLAPSIALETGTGFPAVASIPIMALVCITYTALGGMKAVVWTDVFQSMMMLAGVLAIMIKGLVEVGGFSEAFHLVGEGDRLTWFNFDPDPTVRHTFWGFVFGYSTIWVAIYGLQQASVQRICALRTLHQARMTVLLNLPTLVLLSSLVYCTGVVVVAYYIRSGCDPVASGIISKPNGLLPLFVKDVFKNSPGFGGLFLATLYSGALSSVSSSLSGATANTWDDILSWNFPTLTEYKASIVNKVLVVIYGLLSIGLAFMINTMSGPITQVSLAISGVPFGPVFGIFLISGIKKFSWCNSKGILAGSIIGLVISVWQTVGEVFTPPRASPLPPIITTNCTTSVNITAASVTHYQQKVRGIDAFYHLSYIWKTFFGCLVTMLSCMLCSLIFKFLQKDSEQIDESHFQFLQLCYKSQRAKEVKRLASLARKEKLPGEELQTLTDQNKN